MEPSETRKALTLLFMTVNIKELEPQALSTRLMEIFEAESQAELVNTLSGLVERVDRFPQISQMLDEAATYISKASRAVGDA